MNSLAPEEPYNWTLILHIQIFQYRSNIRVRLPTKEKKAHD